MTDRELLERAAKAAGLSWHDDTDGYGDLPNLYLLPPDEENRMQCWNPLTDDGDALRLAVKLGLEVNCTIPGKQVAYTVHPVTKGMLRVVEDGWHDKFAATRRAIVKAAGYLGRSQ